MKNEGRQKAINGRHVILIINITEPQCKFHAVDSDGRRHRCHPSPLPSPPLASKRFHPCRGKSSGGEEAAGEYGGACTVGTFTEDGVDLVENMHLLRGGQSRPPPHTHSHCCCKLRQEGGVHTSCYGSYFNPVTRLDHDNHRGAGFWSRFKTIVMVINQKAFFTNEKKHTDNTYVF